MPQIAQILVSTFKNFRGGIQSDEITGFSTAADFSGLRSVMSFGKEILFPFGEAFLQSSFSHPSCFSSSR